MATVEVRMPKMGESITEGTVITWYKQQGDHVVLDEALLEIGTDKVDTEVPAPAEGVLGAVLVGEGETVEVGTLLARLETGAQEASAVEEEQPTSAVDTDMAMDVPVVMPKMGESITEGTVITWHKKEGDPVALDETLLEIGTDKVDTEVPSPAAGTLQKILVAEGDTVDVGTLLAVIGAAGKAAASVREHAAEPEAPGREPEPVMPPVAAELEEESVVASGRRLADGRFLSPLVRSIAQAEGLTTRELEALKGSGRDGRLTKKDVMGYLKTRRAATPAPKKAVDRPPSPASVDPVGPRVEIIEMDRMRQLIAKHMTESKRTAAHVTSFAEADVTNLVQLREANKEAFLERDGIRLTYTPFFVYAAVEALRAYPLLNASVEGDQIHIHKDYHVGIAVALETSGLVVPVIRHAGRNSIAGLAHAANDVANRARSNALQPDDLQGGTFTVTNVGSLGSIMGTPIISQPQVAILATGTIAKKPVVIEDPRLGDMIAIRHMMYLSLSYDHRIIDGAMGISFLRRFVEVIEGFNPDMEV